MLKKIFRYLGVILGLLTCLPMFVTTWNLVLEDTTIAEYKLFDKVGDAEKLFFGDKFQQIWLTLLQIIVIVALVVAVVLAVVYILNDLKVIKAQKFEKLLSVVLLLLAIAGLVVVVIGSFTNVNKFLTANYILLGGVGAWHFAVFGILGGIFAMIGACDKAKKRK